MTPEFALQRVKAEPRQAHVARAGRNIEDFHNISDALDLVVTELAHVVLFVEALQAAMTYRLYHFVMYRVSVRAATKSVSWALPRASRLF